MPERRKPWPRLAPLAGAALLVGGGCDASKLLDELQKTKLTVEVTASPAKRPAAPEPSAGTSITIVPPAPRELSGPPRLELTGERRYAGGRPIPWWADRLSRLRRDGPRDLYDLTAARARLSGLVVEERPGGEVAVSVPPAPTPTAAAAAPAGARP